MVRLSLVIHSILWLTATGTPLEHRYAVKERHPAPNRWTKSRCAPHHVMLNLKIMLRMRGSQDIERHLYEVSDPNHHRYGAHLGAKEAHQLMKPHDYSLAAVERWLHGHGFHGQLRYSSAKNVVSLFVSVRDAEKILNTTYSVFKHDDGTEVVRTPEWSLPKYLHEHVISIQPTTSFLHARPKNFRSSQSLTKRSDLFEDEIEQTSSSQQPAVAADNPANIAAVCEAVITPKCLRTLYKTIDYTPKVPDKSYVAFPNFLDETVIHKDLKMFLENHRPDAVNASISIVRVNNGKDDQNLFTQKTPDGITHPLSSEGNLDGETLTALVYPIRVQAYNTGGKPPFDPTDTHKIIDNEPYLEWLDYMLTREQNLSLTISMSYGDDERTVPADYAQHVCLLFGLLGSRGVSILAASGDYGVGSNGDIDRDECRASVVDGVLASCFIPHFPASCPYVTVVGATQDINPEVAADDPKNYFASGGGFSNRFPRPKYQNETLDRYFELHSVDILDPATKKPFQYNKAGRGYPDLAAQGRSFNTTWQQKPWNISGTSASAPVVAGVVALLNDYLLASGSAPMGFLNPWLYAVGYQGFNDIVKGTNKGCRTKGFAAVEGWDPVTGFGTPDFLKLQKLVGTPVPYTFLPEVLSAAQHLPSLATPAAVPGGPAAPVGNPIVPPPVGTPIAPSAPEENPVAPPPPGGMPSAPSALAAVPVDPPQAAGTLVTSSAPTGMSGT